MKLSRRKFLEALGITAVAPKVALGLTDQPVEFRREHRKDIHWMGGRYTWSAKLGDQYFHYGCIIDGHYEPDWDSDVVKRYERVAEKAFRKVLHNA